MKLFICKLLLIALLFAGAPLAFAQEEGATGSVTNLPIPRMASLRSDKVFVRSGPGMRYPIKWIYKKRDYPVQINREFGTWRRLIDKDGEEGWVHQSLLSSRRFAIVDGGDDASILMYRKADQDSAKKARIENGVLVKFVDQEQPCERQWCQVTSSTFKGWVEENSLWGVDAVNESDNGE